MSTTLNFERDEGPRGASTIKNAFSKSLFANRSPRTTFLSVVRKHLVNTRASASMPLSSFPRYNYANLVTKERTSSRGRYAIRLKTFLERMTVTRYVQVCICILVYMYVCMLNDIARNAAERFRDAFFVKSTTKRR